MKLKKIIGLVSIVMLIISCQPNAKKTQEEQITIGKNTIVASSKNIGKTLFNGKARCFSCHKTNQKSIGPSITEIIKIYTEKDGDLIAFLKQEQDPIVDPENYAIMKTNFSLLKTFSDQELTALVTYMNQIAQH